MSPSYNRDVNYLRPIITLVSFDKFDIILYSVQPISIMKILHLFKTFFPESFGGIQEFIKIIATQTAQLGVHNTVLTPSLRPAIEKDNSAFPFEVIRTPQTFEYASCPVSFKMLKVYREIIHQFDILHFHYPWPFGDFVSLIHPVKPLKILVTYHSDIVHQQKLKWLYNPLMKLFFSKVSTFVVSSPNFLNSSKDLEPYRKKSVIVPFGLPQPDVSSEHIQKWRKKVGENYLLFIGQFRYYKGVTVLIEAIEKFPVPTILIGNGALENEIRHQIQQRNLNKYILLLGSVSDLDKYALLYLARALVLPSIARSETFGLALLEGAMMGKPLISTELATGTSYINQQGVTGLIVPPRDPLSLSQAIRQIFSNDALCERMGQASYNHYLSDFTVKKMTQAYMEIYNALVSSKARS